jgi:hypothetical protein
MRETRWRMKLYGSLVVVAAATALATSAEAQSIRHVLRTAPALVGLPGLASGPYQNAVDVMLEQAVRNLPLFPAASAAYSFRWNAATNQLERVGGDVSPFLFTERGQTMGQGIWNFSVTWGRYNVECSSGCRLGDDHFPVSVSAAAIRYKALTDLDYTVGTFNLTYGVTDDIDVNIAVPIMTLDADLNVSRQDNPSAPVRSATRALEAANLSDMMVRAKYRLFETTGRGGSAYGAGGVRVRIPSGNPNEGLGTGYGEIGPYLAISATSLLAGMLDSYFDAGIDAGIGDLRRSSGHYSWAVDMHVPRDDNVWWSRIALAVSLLGRSEFAGLREPSSISGPHVTPAGFANLPYLCIDTNRHDYLDATFGLRMQLYQSFALSLGVFKALNNVGVRPAGWSPLGSFEATF